MSYRYLILVIIGFKAFQLKAQSTIVTRYKSIIPASYYYNTFEKEASILGQNSIAAANMYLDLGRSSLVHSEDLSIEYELKAKELFSHHKQDAMVVQTNLSLTLPYINKGMYEVADKIILEVFDYARKFKNEKIKADAYLRLGYKEYASGNLDKALAAYFNCFEYYQNKKSNHELGDLVMRMGATYAEMGDCATALKYWETYIAEYIPIKNQLDFSIPIKSNMIDCYIKDKNFKKAKQLSQEVIQSRKESNANKLLSKAYSSLSVLSKLSGQYKPSLYYLDSAIWYAAKFKSQRQLSALHIDRSDVYYMLNKKVNAINDLELALKNAILSNSPILQLQAYDKLAKIYHQMGKNGKAYIYNQKSDSIKDKMFSAEVISSMKNMEKQVALQNSKQQIFLLENQNRLKNQNIIQQKKLSRISTLLLVISGLLLLLFAYWIRVRTRTNRLLREKNVVIEKALSENKMLVKEVHHRVKNNLQIVASLIGLQGRFTNDKGVHDAVISIKTRVQAMSLLHQQLYQNEDLRSISIKSYFEDLCESLTSTYSTHVQNIVISAEIESIYLDLDQVVTLGVIVNELIANSIKHAFVNKEKGNIRLSIKSAIDMVLCEVRDNGVGIPFTHLPEKSSSMGMQLISSFMNKLNAEINIDNANGTVINFTFRKQHQNA
ncbi:MAG: sensor histidine kinase [Saprospiraceae bacterium]|nr:sensor histidine kinase [Saprospiraceae bacterium]